MDKIRYVDLTPEQRRAFSANWNGDGSPCGWERTEEYFEFTNDAAYRFDYWRDILIKQIARIHNEKSIPTGPYGLLDYRVWTNIGIVARSTKKAADVGCQSGLYPAMMLLLGIGDVTIFEIRENATTHPNIKFVKKDLTYDDSINEEYDLVTCASTIEHVGLARYGDPLDPDGDLKIMKSIRKMTKIGGHVVLAFPYTPSGAGHIVWNHHRVYNQYRRDLLFKGFQIMMEHDIGEFQPTWLLRRIT